MGKKHKNLGNHFKCSACLNLQDGLKKQPCELYSEDEMTVPTQCVFGMFNMAKGSTRAKWNRVKK